MTTSCHFTSHFLQDDLVSFYDFRNIPLLTFSASGLLFSSSLFCRWYYWAKKFKND